jgi:uncharacterized protein (TIGR00369 family)
MPAYLPQNPQFADTVEALIQGMPIAQFYGVKFLRIEPGETEIEMPFRSELAFRPGVLQAGPIGTLLDFAGATAAMTLLAPGWSSATIDYTVKLLAPAQGDRFIGHGSVIAPGKSIVVAQAEVFAVAGEQKTLCAVGHVTVRNFEPR